uniref:Uncharacterized protein n=1 Tax=Parascaris univalens TaxID=6257 RepID=A0A915B2U6_PARUN
MQSTIFNIYISLNDIDFFEWKGKRQTDLCS